MVVDVGLQQVQQRRGVRFNRHRIKTSRIHTTPAFRNELCPQNNAENDAMTPILISKINSFHANTNIPVLQQETEVVQSHNEKGSSMKMLDRVTSAKDAFWVIPNRLLISTAVRGDDLPSELSHFKISVIARLLSNSGGLSPKTRNKPIRYRTAARVVNFNIDPRLNSLATILSDVVHQIVNLLKTEAVLIQCPNDVGWDLAISALLLAGSACVSIQEAISRLRMLCMATEKRWTMDTRIESILLHQLQKIPHVMATVSETITGSNQIALGNSKKAALTRRPARPMLVALRPHSTRVIVAEPFKPVEVRRLVAAREHVQQE